MAQVVAQSVLALPWMWIIALACIPIVLAVFSRSSYGVMGSSLLSVLSFVLLLPQAEDSSNNALALLTYSGALLIAIGGYGEKRREMKAEAQQREIEQLRKEVMMFLEALDRRAQLVDKLSVGSPAIPMHQSGTTNPEARATV